MFIRRHSNNQTVIFQEFIFLVLLTPAVDYRVFLLCFFKSNIEIIVEYLRYLFLTFDSFKFNLKYFNVANICINRDAVMEELHHTLKIYPQKYLT
jgi:hypothetical protein